MRRYLLVLDMDFLAFDARFEEAPINHLLASAGGETCEVFVLSLVDTRAGRLPTMDLMLGAAVRGPRPLPRGRRPTHDLDAEARHRMNRALRQLHNLGWPADGVISRDGLYKAVTQEVGLASFDQVILAMDPDVVSRRARWLRLRRLRHLLGDRLVEFALPGRRPLPGR